MLNLRRTAVFVGLLSVLVMGVAFPALADDGWGKVDCEQNPHPTCDLWAGKGEQHGGREDDGGTGSSGEDSDEDGSAEPEAPSDRVIGEANLANCDYLPSDYQPPSQVVASGKARGTGVPPEARPVAITLIGEGRVGGGATVLVAAPAGKRIAVPIQQPGQGDGAWYVYRCRGSGFRDALYRPPVWLPDEQPADGQNLPSPEDLAQRARSQLRLPSPGIESSPAGAQLVNLPTWLWLDRDEWGPVSATASVPGVSVTATAEPRSVSWSMGDGSTVTCQGPGTPYSAQADPKRPSPDCGHTYRASSAGAPDAAFLVTATVHWTVTWSGAGESGEFPDITTTSSTGFQVAEAQALTTR